MLRSVMRIPALVCLLLLASVSTAAAQSWTYAASEHFEVYTTGGDRRAREALAYFEHMHAFFAEFLKLRPRPGALTRLVIFAGERQFAPYRPNDFTGAYYQGGPERDYIVMQSLDRNWRPVAIHEYAHLIAQHSGHAYPLWLDEGLAEFFSTMTPDGNRMQVGEVAVQHLQHLNDGGALMDLDRLFAVGHDSAEYNTNAHAGLFYSQSWALTHMLLTDDRYRAATPDFLNLIADGRASAAALQSAYGRSLDAVSRDLAAYVRQRSYQYFRVAYAPPPAGTPILTRAVDPFEAGLVTAHLLANRQERETEARAAFDRLAAVRPDDLQLLESRAYFELRHGETANARPLLARAAELGSVDPHIYRNLAIIEPGRAEDLLARAVALAPDDFELRLHYATVLFSAGKSGRTVTILAQVTRVPPEDAFPFFQLLGNAYLHLNEIDRARDAAVRAGQYAEPGEEAAYAARLLEAIERFAPAEPETSAGAAPAPLRRGADGRSPALEITVTGRIRNMVCGADAPVMEVWTPEGTLRLLIDRPAEIRVQGVNGPQVELSCGAQDVPIRIGYIPEFDLARGAVGAVRLLDYLAP